MSGQTTIPETDDGLDPHTLREHGADFTPLPVIRQMLRRIPPGWPSAIVEPGAGPGPFCKVAREHFGAEVYTCGVEIRGSDREHLKQNADECYIGDFHEWSLAEHGHAFDLCVGNPPFHDIPRFVESGLRVAPVVVYLAPLGWALRSGEKAEWLQAHLPRGLDVIAGPLSFRGNGSSAFQDYAWWMWDRDKLDPRHTFTNFLPRLPSADRRWTVRPGTEP